MSLALLLLLATISIANAATPLGGQGFLKVDQAFRFHVHSPAPATLRVRFRIHPGYYLYRKRFHFKLVNPPGKLHITSVDIPSGQKEHDPYFGEVEIYHNQALATLHLSSAAAHDTPLKLQVGYQGCASKGLCYPPQKRVVSIAAAADKSNADGQQPGVATSTADTVPPSSDQARLSQLLGNAGLLWIALTFLGLGVLLAFTPCVLPMIPILTGIIAGQGERNSARRGFTLSLVYVLAMAVAYTLFGVLVGLIGENLQAALQTPVALSIFAALFAVLALSMFGLYQLQLPSALRDRLTHASERQRGGHLLGSAIMGFIAALIVGPCITPALAGALLYIGQNGNAAIGALALFALGLGMGLPLIVLGTLGGHWLPRAGAWMSRVQHVFGVLFLGVAIWMLARVIPEAATLALWAVLLMIVAVYLGALEPIKNEAANGWHRLFKGVGVVALVYGTILAVGAVTGGTGPLHPLSGLGQSASRSGAVDSDTRTLSYQTIDSMQSLNDALNNARENNQPVMLEFDADWCISCKRMKRNVLSKPRVQELLRRVVRLRVDLTDMTQPKNTLMRNLQVFGPPTFLFFAPDGKEKRAERLTGEAGLQTFIQHLQAVLNHE